MTVESNSKVSVFGFIFPFRDVKGKEIVDEHTFHEWLASEPGGSFAVSGSGMWHGGIHISADGAGKRLDLEHGLRCMFKGEVIAYRANRAPVVTRVDATGNSAAQIARYSSAFTLVRHTLEYPAGNRLTLFSLYMHLQSVDEYRQTSMAMPTYWARSHEVTRHAADKQKTTSQPGVPAPRVGLNVHAAAGSGTILGLLPHGARVRIGTRSRDGKWGKLDAIESGELISPQVASYVRREAHAGWVYLGRERGHVLLEEVVSDVQCDKVMVPSTPVPIDAGDLIGHLGQYWQVADPARENRMAHIEVFCGDELPGFLTASREAAKRLGFDERPLLRIGKGVKLFAGHSIDEEGATAPETAVIQVYNQAALDALPAQDKGPKDDALGDGQPWWRVTSANSRYDDINGWVRNRQMPPNGGVTRETPHSWSDFETVTGSDAGNPTIFGTVDAWLDHMLCEDKPATGDIGKLKPLACSLYRALSPMRNESRAADEIRALSNHKWLSFRASRLIPRHRSEWASRTEYSGFFDKVLQRVTKEPYHDAEMERIAKLVWWDDVSNAVTGPFPSSPDVFHIHPVALVGNFFSPCDCKRRFEKISKIVLANEGGFVNDPSDSGGATNKGIAWATWTTYAKPDVGIEPTLDNLINLTDEQAKTIYLKRYWQPRGFCKIINERTALNIYDWTITSGQAVKKIQQILISDFSKKIECDNKITDDFIFEINSIVDQNALVEKIGISRKKYYTKLAFNPDGSPSKNHKFLTGWINRVDRCLSYKGQR